MAFRKRNVGISQSSAPSVTSTSPSLNPSAPAITGIRPSPVDGRPTTSTGTPSLDGILAGHAGLALGNSILIEENGTTDYAAALLRYYAAEGVVQGHQVHVVGVGEFWGRELPGLVGPADDRERGPAQNKEKMKIAWRYEQLGNFGSGVSGSRGRLSESSATEPVQGTAGSPSTENTVFCHAFDLTKRLVIPAGTKINFIPITPAKPHSSPFTSVLDNLRRRLCSESRSTVHRVVIQALLSPAWYPPEACQPRNLLQFLHSVRSLLRQYANQLTVMITLPLDLYPRSTGLVRWAELLSDGVMELTPFPHLLDSSSSALASSGAATSHEEQPQGMLKIHRLPVFHERGGGGGGLSGLGIDLAFVVSRRKFLIKPFNLPPVESDSESQHDRAKGGQTAIDIEF